LSLILKKAAANEAASGLKSEFWRAQLD